LNLHLVARRSNSKSRENDDRFEFQQQSRCKPSLTNAFYRTRNIAIFYFALFEDVS
jgi:hypothetical protein